MTPPPHILLTGGTGFFGRSLLRHWAATSDAGALTPQVTVLSRNPDTFARNYPDLARAPWLRVQKGDVCVRTSLPQGQAFSHILHAATDSTLGPQLSPLERYDQIVDGTRNLLDLAIASKAKRFLLTGSGAVYGPQPAGLTHLPESYNGMPDPLQAGNAYGVAKRTAEHLCALYFKTHGLETVVARCFAFVGPDLPLDVHFAIGNFIRDALCEPAIMVRGDGSPVRSYLDQRDLAVWLTQLLDNGVAGEAYNVGSDQAITVAELANLVGRVLAPNKDVHFSCTASASTDRNIYVPSIEKARQALGLQVKISLEDAIRETAKRVYRQSMGVP